MPRIIYSLHFDLADPKYAPRIVGLVAPLDANGDSRYCRPCPPIRRVVDLRVGHALIHTPSRIRYGIKAVRVYREAEAADVCQVCGYAVPGS